MASLLYGERGTGQYQGHLRKSFANNWIVALSGGFTQTEKKGDGLDLDAQYIVKRYNNNTLIGGVNYSYLQASRDIANTPPHIYDENDKLFFVYAQEEIRLINRKLELTLGGRFDKWDSLDGVFSQKATMNLSLLKSRANLRLSAGSSFRRPAFDENFYFVTWPGGWFKGAAIEAITEISEFVAGELLGPKKLTAYEIGIRVTPFSTMLIGVETLYNEVKDNIGYTVYEFDAGNLNLDLRFRYVSDLAYQEISSITVDDYLTVDFALSKDFTDGIFAKLGALNLTDNDHFEYPMYTKIKRKALLTVQYSF